MKRREAVLALFVAAAVVFGLLTVFAIELSNTQAKSKRDVEQRVHERAVLAAGLIDSLFQASERQAPMYSRTYGGRVVSDHTMDANRNQSQYLVLLDPAGHVLASSKGFNAQARRNLV